MQTPYKPAVPTPGPPAPTSSWPTPSQPAAATVNPSTAYAPAAQQYPGMVPPAADYAPAHGYQQHMTQSVNVNVGGPNIAFVTANNGPSFFVRALYFIFVGWWLGGFWIALSYLMIIPIVTIPVFAKMINMLPQIMTLRPRQTSYQMRQQDNLTIIEQTTTPQRNFFLRAAYFLLIGFWLVGIWLTAAYLLSLTVIGLPLAFLMFNRAGAVATLYKN